MELGETILTIALILSVYALAAHIIGIWKKKNELFDSARIAVIGIAVLTTIASIWLFNLFRSDFERVCARSPHNRNMEKEKRAFRQRQDCRHRDRSADHYRFHMAF